MTIALISDYPVIDMHAHLRRDVVLHTHKAYNSGINLVVAMPNTDPCLDNADVIKEYSGYSERGATKIPFLPTSAITIGREGKKPVNVHSLYPHVVGFTDDGNCLRDLDILKYFLSTDVLTMLYCGEEGPLDEWPRSTTETEWIDKYLELNKDVMGNLYLQHISRADSVDLIRQAKSDGVKVIAETCPHYFKWTEKTMRVPVNPPIGDKRDRDAVREGLSDGTIDVIASDYAPEPRPKGTGIADWENYIASCKSLVDDGVVTERRLMELVYLDPLDVLRSSGACKSKGFLEIVDSLDIDS